MDSKKPYNTMDMVFSQIPLRNPKEKNLYESKSLFCSQAAVLVLRSCLDEHHVLQPVLSNINSRTVSPTGRTSADAAGGLIGRFFGPKKE